MPLHRDFTPAAWRGTTNTDGKLIGVSFDLADGTIVRLSLACYSARMCAESILDYLNATNRHPESSDGNPKVAVSVQAE